VSLDTECDENGAELPYHLVTVPAFEINVTEVTVTQYTPGTVKLRRAKSTSGQTSSATTVW